MSSKSVFLVQRWMLQPRMLLVLILLQFIIQFFTSAYLYKYVANVENDLRLIKDQYPLAIPRRRRSSALPTAEDNTVSDISSRVCERLATSNAKEITLKNNRIGKILKDSGLLKIENNRLFLRFWILRF